MRKTIRMMMKNDLERILERILEEKDIDIKRFEREREKVSGEPIERKYGSI